MKLLSYQKLFNFLKIILATVDLSGDSYSISCLVYCIFTSLLDHLSDFSKDKKYQFLKQTICSIQDKMNEYWPKIKEIAAVCMMLDPRQKANLFSNSTEKKNFIKKIEEIYQLYESSTTTYNQANSNEENPKNKTLPILDRAWNLKIKDVFTNELKSYLKDPVIAQNSNYDILQWWKLSKETYPVLAKMAKDYLAIMPASVASERSFSVGGQTISKDRCNLHTETARELMCVKSWMKFKFEKSDL